MEFELGARFEGACGFALVLALNRLERTDLAPLAVPICTRTAIHLIGRVVSLRSQAAPASLPGSLRLRVPHSDSCQLRRSENWRK